MTESVPPTRAFRMKSAGLQGCLSAVGGTLFLGMAVAGASGALGGDVATRLMITGVFGLFGLLMAAGAVSLLGRRDKDRRVEIGPSGLHVPEMGLLPWSAIAEVRSEVIRGLVGGDVPVTRRIRRLGVVPRDTTLRPRAATRAGAALAMGFFGFLNRMAPEIRLGGDQPAPFGVSETELEGSFDELVAAVVAFAPVVDAAKRRALERAPRWSAPPAGTSGGLTSEARIHDLDAALGTSSGSGAAFAPASPLVPDVARPRATILTPPARLGDIVRAGIPLLPLSVFFSIAGSTGAFAGPSGQVFTIVFVIILSAFVLPPARAIWTAIGRSRARVGGRARLTIDPDGIWLPEMGRVAWDAVREIRTERAGSTRSSAGPAVERWRLVIEPIGRTTFGVASDEIDTDFDDVLDLVRSYRPVVETD